jgi:signal transduction histidine kinase
LTDNSTTGIDCIGDVPWGTHLCGFYGTRRDLIDSIVPYFTAGLKNDEFCVWVTSDPLDVEDTRTELRKAIPHFDRYLDINQMEIWDYRDWYLRGGSFDADRVFGQWAEKEKKAAAKGYRGLRAAGNTAWLEEKDWPNFMAYEGEVNRSFPSHRIIGLCTYHTEDCGADAMLEVIRHHQHAVAQISGRSEIIEGSILKERMAHLETTNAALEARLCKQASLSAQLQRFSAHLLDEQDKARRQIAAQLHEVTAQNLFAISVNLANLRVKTEDTELATTLAESQTLCEQSLKQLRTLSYFLHPPILDIAGLVPALRSYIDGFVKQNGIRVELVLTSEIGRLPGAVETDLFRVVQEGLWNVADHSGSSAATVRLEQRPNLVILEIEDFGRGMPVSSIDALSGGREMGLGILCMRERLQQLGGWLEIRSSRKGTSLVASVPLRDAETVVIDSTSRFARRYKRPQHRANGAVDR